jgi:hypothetical protein
MANGQCLDTLLDLFMKAQSPKEPHKATLDSFFTVLQRVNPDFAIKHSSWLNEHDLLGPFTAHLKEDRLSTKLIEKVNSCRDCTFLKTVRL